MASLETDRFLVDMGLRVVQLLPSIVIGESRNGNNRGDTKVVNAPINAFGRAKEAVTAAGRDPLARARAPAVGFLGGGIPLPPPQQGKQRRGARGAAGIHARRTSVEGERAT